MRAPDAALEEVEAVLADFEQPQVRRHRADVHDVAAEVEHVVADAGQLGEQHPQILRAHRHFDVEQLLDGEHVGVLHRQRRAIVQPVEIGQRLEIGLVLDQLLGAAVEQADMRIDPLDDLAVELHHHAQHAVRGGVLRAEVDRVVGDDLVAGGGRLFGCTASPSPDLAPFALFGRRAFAASVSRAGRASAGGSGDAERGSALGVASARRLALGDRVAVGLVRRSPAPVSAGCQWSWASRRGEALAEGAAACGAGASRRPAAHIPRLPGLMKSNCANPAPARPAHRPRASRNSAVRKSLRRVALEAVVGEDAAQVRIAGEDHAVHVEHLALEPARDRPQRGDGRHRRVLGGADLDHDAVVFGQAEQHVNDFEALGAVGIVGPGDLHQLLVFVIVAQQAQRVLDPVARR